MEELTFSKMEFHKIISLGTDSLVITIIYGHGHASGHHQCGEMEEGLGGHSCPMERGKADWTTTVGSGFNYRHPQSCHSPPQVTYSSSMEESLSGTESLLTLETCHVRNHGYCGPSEPCGPLSTLLTPCPPSRAHHGWCCRVPQ